MPPSGPASYAMSQAAANASTHTTTSQLEVGAASGPVTTQPNASPGLTSPRFAWPASPHPSSPEGLHTHPHHRQPPADCQTARGSLYTPTPPPAKLPESPQSCLHLCRCLSAFEPATFQMADLWTCFATATAAFHVAYLRTSFVTAATGHT